ncbi:MAG TPA: RNA polymerase sigma factor [Polyangiaceae bacterium]|nr:RNA polymerase sigma factor [Polyangiaceae bacterium]
MQNLELAEGTLGVDEPASDLLERLRAGEPRAVGTAYDQHHHAVRAFARRLLGDASVAEDLVHDVFVRLPKAASNFRGDSSLRTFLISIAVNRARHFVRAATRQRAAVERMAREPHPHSEDPEQHLGRRQLADALARALSALPLEQRVAFVLCEVEQRSSIEVAGIVDAPEGTVRTRLYHARRKLREALAAEGLA